MQVRLCGAQGPQEPPSARSWEWGRWGPARRSGRYHGTERCGELVHAARGREDEHLVAQRLRQPAQHQPQYLPVRLLCSSRSMGGGSTHTLAPQSPPQHPHSLVTSTHPS